MARIGGDAKNILLNKDLIAINQDPLGKPVVLVQRYTNDHDVFSGPLANGDEAVLLFNHKSQSAQLSLDLTAELGIESADVKDLYTGEVQRAVRGIYTRPGVGAHGSAPLRLSNIRRGAAPSVAASWVEAESGSGADVANCGACSGGKKVGGIGGSKTLTVRGLRATGDRATVLFDYINAEIGYLAGQGQNVRLASISVNDGPFQEVSFPISGYDWSLSVAKNYRVSLSGFKAGNDNKITMTAKSGFAPDFDRVGVMQQQ